MFHTLAQTSPSKVNKLQQVSLMINGNLIDSTITNQRTQRLEVPPPQAADIWRTRTCWCSWRCNRAHWRSQYIPLKSTCKYDFGLHLSKTTSFLEIQMVQQIAEAAVSNNKLCLVSPTLHHRLNRSSTEDGCDKPNTKWTARPKNFAWAQLKNKCCIVSGTWQ